MPTYSSPLPLRGASTMRASVQVQGCTVGRYSARRSVLRPSSPRPAPLPWAGMQGPRPAEPPTEGRQLPTPTQRQEVAPLTGATVALPSDRSWLLLQRTESWQQVSAAVRKSQLSGCRGPRVQLRFFDGAETCCQDGGAGRGPCMPAHGRGAGRGEKIISHRVLTIPFCHAPGGRGGAKLWGGLLRLPSPRRYSASDRRRSSVHGPFGSTARPVR